MAPMVCKYHCWFKLFNREFSLRQTDEGEEVFDSSWSLQEKFGDVMTGILLLGELFAELMWGASILIALGMENLEF